MDNSCRLQAQNTANNSDIDKTKTSVSRQKLYLKLKAASQPSPWFRGLLDTKNCKQKIHCSEVKTKLNFRLTLRYSIVTFLSHAKQLSLQITTTNSSCV